jgi:hypothetical protein
MKVKPLSLLQPKEVRMATSDQEQMGAGVPQHKRIAMGAKLDGSSLQPKGQPVKAPAKTQGGLSQAKKK